MKVARGRVLFFTRILTRFSVSVYLLVVDYENENRFQSAAHVQREGHGRGGKTGGIF
jgi:hypothetical protein